jgi:hypothetical protein
MVETLDELANTYPVNTEDFITGEEANWIKS